MPKKKIFFKISIPPLILAVAYLFLRALAASPALDNSALPTLAVVSKVIDGDTIEISQGQSVRYIGIDTPELRSRQGGHWKLNPRPFAEEAAQANRKLVEGKKVRLEYDVEKKDRYGRLLAYVFVDELFVNAYLLQNGFALLSTHPPNIKYVDLFVKLQKEAREKRRGLWSAPQNVE
jgi:micrococcal nuclease